MSRRVEFQLTISLIAACAAAGTALAQSGDDLAACRAVRTDEVRLACYDALADRAARNSSVEPTAETAPPAPTEMSAPPAMEAVSAPSQSAASIVEAPAPAAPAAVDAEQAAIDAFGARGLPKPEEEKEQELNEISSTVAAIETSASNRVVVTLANGQVWRQLDADTARIGAEDAVGRTATIKKGMLGSHKMKIDDGRAFKVKRVE